MPNIEYVRRAALAAAAAEIVFWLYTLLYISRHVNLLGDGREWASELPLTIVAVTLAFPALVLSPFARVAWVSAGLAVAAAVADAVIWAQVLSAFAAKT